MSQSHPAPFADQLMDRLDELACATDEPGRLTRFYLSQAHRRAADLVSSWMRDAGMTVRLDNLGTLVGRYEGEQPGSRTFIMGSHIDTVRDAGKYDGNLGVLAAIAAVGQLARDQKRLPFAIEVVAFGDEEGVRFPSTLSGSRGLAGQFDPANLESRDRAGMTLREALAEFGLDAAAWPSAARSPGDVFGYLELHIEQGPVLEAAGLPLGIVTAIAGATRLKVAVTGNAGHAGTVPMALRQDALAAASEMVLSIERIAKSTADLVATVGTLEVRPGAVNVVPGSAVFTIDVRAPVDTVRNGALREIAQALHEIAARRNVSVSTEVTHDAPATTCDAALMAILEEAVRSVGVTPMQLMSGAGHDAMAVARLCPVAMLFLRCKGGVSHNPAESITAEDADLAVRALYATLMSPPLAQRARLR